ncbi:MAG: AMP-binding protein [Gemmatimonadaceae bacterium]|nr:AMP-binding protein [Gemmatimonadaceae bacterium]
MLWFKGRDISWRTIHELSDAFAVALQANGVRPGDRVAILLPNRPQFFIAQYGAWKAGAIVTPMNPIYTEEELIGPLVSTGATVMITLSAFYERVKAVQSRTAVRRVILTSIKEWFPPLLRTIFTLFAEKKLGHRATARDGDLWFNALLEQHRGARPDVPRPSLDDTALLLLSGGTTGTPKCVMAHHQALVIAGKQLSSWLGDSMPRGTGTFMLPLPMFHSYGAVGIQRVRFDSLKVCLSGAAPLMLETRRRFESISGAHITEAWLLTEALLAATGGPLHAPLREGSVGVPIPDVDVRIVDADDATKPMPVGEVGEILVTGPQVMRGYWNQPEESAEMVRTLEDGRRWVFTGDLGKMDADGFIWIVDRKKDLIKPGGMQVWPREIEETISRIPAVAEVGVRRFPDAAKGDVAVAFVVLRDGMQATAEEIRVFCKEHLAFYKVPSRVVFKRELPKSLIGKVLRRLLTESA